METRDFRVQRHQENETAIRTAKDAFYAALFADLTAQGATVEKGDFDSFRVNGHYISSYTLAVTGMVSNAGRFSVGTFNGTLLITLRMSNGRHSNNRTWRTRKDGTVKTAEVAETLIHLAQWETKAQQERAEAEARRKSLAENPEFQALKVAAQGLCYVTEQSGHVKLELGRLSVEEATRIVALVREMRGSSEE